MTEVSLLRPLWLLALPLLALAGVWLIRRRAALGGWDRVVRPEMLAALRALGRVESGGRRWAGLVPLLAAALIALALSGPAVERRDTAAFRNMDAVIFVLDASPSATGGPDWRALQTMGRYGVAALGSRPAALIVFAGDAYVATDMTADRRQLGQTLSLIGPQTVPDPGSRPALALARARAMLDEAGVVQGDVILLTDGGGLGPDALAEAAALAGRGARLSVVAPAPGESTETLAKTGGGEVFATTGAEALAEYLDASARARLERQDWPLLYWADRGRLVLLLSMVPVLLLFRRRAA